MGKAHGVLRRALAPEQTLAVRARHTTPPADKQSQPPASFDGSEAFWYIASPLLNAPFSSQRASQGQRWQSACQTADPHRLPTGQPVSQLNFVCTLRTSFLKIIPFFHPFHP